MDSKRRPRPILVMERPAISAGRPRKYPIGELLNTLTSTKAIRVPYGKSKARTVILSLAKAASRRNLRFRYKRDDDAVICWVEVRTGGGA